MSVNKKEPFGWLPRRRALILSGVGLIALIAANLWEQALLRRAGLAAARYNAVWLSFDAGEIASLNRDLLLHGAMPAYVLAHRVDLVFAICYAVFFFGFFVAAARKMQAAPILGPVSRAFPWVALGVSAFDLIETSLVLCSTVRPLAIPGWLPPSQGAANVLKLMLYGAVLLWTVVCLVRPAASALKARSVRRRPA